MAKEKIVSALDQEWRRTLQGTFLQARGLYSEILTEVENATSERRDCCY